MIWKGGKKMKSKINFDDLYSDDRMEDFLDK